MATQPSVVLIDDDEKLLVEFAGELRTRFQSRNVEVRTWVPTGGEDPIERLEALVDAETALVVTDYDLTKGGLTGLFGSTVVGWCQTQAVPVGDFSRGNPGSLPTVPNLFELRVPTELGAAIDYTVAVAGGFMLLKAQLTAHAAEMLRATPAETLAVLLDRPDLESQFALYMSRISSANSSLIDRIQPAGEGAAPPKATLLAYVVGHVLTNAILRYPGPILSSEALAAYLSTTPEAVAEKAELFADARYTGPFAGGGDYFWRVAVDEILENYADQVTGNGVGTIGEWHRSLFAAAVGVEVADHACARCGGRDGGYLCPLTDRPVCERSDCSVAANSWIPAGADLCRIERDFYDEWSPLLGL